MSSPATTYNPVYDAMINAFDIDEVQECSTEGASGFYTKAESVSYFDLSEKISKEIEAFEDDATKLLLLAGSGGEFERPTFAKQFFLGIVVGDNQSNNRSYIKADVLQDDAIRGLEALSGLTYGWDGYDGIPPSIEAINDAIRFIRTRIGSPSKVTVSASSEGEVELYWERMSVFLNLCFDGSGKFSAYGERIGRSGVVRDELLLDNVPFDFGCENEYLTNTLEWIFKD